MRRRSFHATGIWLASLLPALMCLAACSTVADNDVRPQDRVAEDSANERAVEWARLIALAARQDGYAGFMRTADRLLIGYTSEPAARLGAITQRADVEAFLAPRSLDEMDRLVAEVGRRLTAMGVQDASVAADRLTGDVIVTDAFILTDTGGRWCDQMTPVPGRVGGLDVTVRDRRACRQRPGIPGPLPGP
jgi:hypothetical protein